MILVFSILALYIILILTIVIYSSKDKTLKPHKKSGITKVSIIVAARNEEHTIPTLMTSLFNQNYPKHLTEIIIINDHSTDGTQSVLEEYKKQITLIELPDSLQGKKQAISMGVKAASGDLIITTDADCTLQTTHISAIESLYISTQAKFISAPVFLEYQGTSWFSKLLYHFQIVEFGSLITAGNALIKMKRPLLCNGANMAYPKTIFEEVSGYEGNDHLASGDDEYLLRKISQKYPNHIYFLNDKRVCVNTPALTSFAALKQQRIRWASKHKTYRISNIIILVVMFLANIFLYGTLFLPGYPYLFFLIYFAAKTMIDASITATYLRYNFSIKTFLYLPIIELLYPFYLIYIGWFANFMKYEWKGRLQKA